MNEQLLTDRPMSQRVHDAAVLMADGAPVPSVEAFAHLDVAPAGTERPTEPAADPAPTEPSMDFAAFDSLPADIRTAVITATAHVVGSNALRLEAEAELCRPDDVGRYITDPARYVDADGRIDRAAMRADLQRLRTERPELARFGHGPGQEPYRPDDRRRAAPGSPLGVGAAPTTSANVATVLEQMAKGR